jgi:hypothetical protein
MDETAYNAHDYGSTKPDDAIAGLPILFSSQLFSLSSNTAAFV